jgi:hypothetical protein
MAKWPKAHAYFSAIHERWDIRGSTSLKTLGDTPRQAWAEAARTMVSARRFSKMGHGPKGDTPETNEINKATKAENDLINLCNHNIASETKVLAIRKHVARAVRSALKKQAPRVIHARRGWA